MMDRIPLLVLLLVACAGWHSVRPDPEPPRGFTRVDMLRPGGQYLTYDASQRGSAPLALAYDPEDKHWPGRVAFLRDWLVTGAEGETLAGPGYDASTCTACHVEAAPLRPGFTPPLVARTVTSDDAARYGQQINLNHVDGAANRIHIETVDAVFRYSDGSTQSLSRPVAHAMLDGEMIPVGLRSAPLLFGWGLIEQANQGMLAFFHDPDDANGDGISGRMTVRHDAANDSDPAMAFLGWKNGQTSLRSQISAALANDMGVISRAVCEACEAEISNTELDALTNFVRYIGVPDRRRGVAQRGQDLFGITGCNDCHVTVMVTNSGQDPELSGQLIWPYSDLMLHDMGEGLADPGDSPDRREWRTAPLWGVGIVETRYPERGFLHDGRAKTLEEAVLWHDGEARRSRDAFASLNRADREALLAYVRSL